METLLEAKTEYRDSLSLIRQRCQSVLILAQTFCIPDRLMIEREAIDNLEIIHRVRVEDALNWNVGTIAECGDLLGSDLHLILELDGQDSSFGVCKAILDGSQPMVEDISDFLRLAETITEEQGNDIQVVIRLTITKVALKTIIDELLSRRPEYLGTPEMLSKTTVKVFFQSRVWFRFLAPNSVQSLEQYGFIKDGHRLIVVLCDATGYCAGPALELLGTNMSNDIPWLTFSREEWFTFCSGARKTRELCRKESDWDIELETLTPEYLQIREFEQGLQSAMKLLQVAQASISAAYLAKSVQITKNAQLTLSYSGSRPCQCTLPNSVDDILGDDADYSHMGLFNLAIWSYLHGSPDKLLIVRECLSRDLPANGQISLAALENLSKGIFQAAKADFVFYLHHNTQQYFQLRQQAFDAVSSYAEKVEKTISELSADVLDSLYKAAGVLAGAMAAVVFQPRITTPVLISAIIIHVAYFSFILIYVMPLRYKRYSNEKMALKVRLRAMSELSLQERKRIRSSASKADADFEINYRRAWIIYLCMCVGGAVFIFLSVYFAHAYSQVPLLSPQPGGAATPTPTIKR